MVQFVDHWKKATQSTTDHVAKMLSMIFPPDVLESGTVDQYDSDIEFTILEDLTIIFVAVIFRTKNRRSISPRVDKPTQDERIRNQTTMTRTATIHSLQKKATHEEVYLDPKSRKQRTMTVGVKNSASSKQKTYNKSILNRRSTDKQKRQELSQVELGLETPKQYKDENAPNKSRSLKQNHSSSLSVGNEPNPIDEEMGRRVFTPRSNYKQFQCGPEGQLVEVNFSG